ncbi:MAG: riboflavin biosynthesis protein RibF [Defluviitaleaceae bacterium]|nr:riboflavin biosynthesis protein RibF [Defluviitaleaceae bacterium]
MQIFTDKNVDITAATAVSIGKFDGVHRGHIALLDELKHVASKKGLKTLVLTFSPHPMAFFTGKHFPTILEPAEKLEIIRNLGIDYYVEYTFDAKFAQTEPEAFLRNILHDKLKGQAMVIAQDYRFGKMGKGNADLARKVGDELGIAVSAIPHILHDGHKIGSEYLRKLITEKNFTLISELCGRDFCVSGIVGSGAQNGRKMGFPTANIKPHPDKILPPNSVYATTTIIDKIAYKSITNIGFRPTVDLTNDVATLETHILGLDDNLYGKKISVIFDKWMRDERKFASFDELSAELARNCTQREIM